MSMIEISIANSLQESFPAISVAALRVSIEDTTVLRGICASLTTELGELKSLVIQADPITDIPEITAWRQVYAQTGVKPSKYYSSIESLLRRLKKDQDFATGLAIVDFYNLVSVLCKAPIGAYDVAKLPKPNINLRFSKPQSDTFDPLGGDSENFPLNAQLPVYAVEDSIVCWGFNTRDSKLVCVDDQTKDVLFFSESALQGHQHIPIRTMASLATYLDNTPVKVSKPLYLNSKNSSGKI